MISSLNLQRTVTEGTARRVSGFTLIELLMVIAVVAILAALALPSFKTVVARYRVRTAAEDLASTLYLARSEAFKRGNVVLRKGTAPGCSAPDTKDWSCGWQVFADDNGNGALDAGENVLQSAPAPAGVTLSLSIARTSLPLNRWGEFNSMGAFSFGISPAGSDDLTLKTLLCMSSGGRLRAVQGQATCSS